MSSKVPGDRRYASSHEWAWDDDGIVTVGITEFAVHQLGDLVFIDLPETGDSVTAGEAFGEVESVKAVSELISPLSGDVVDVNSGLEDSLETLGDSPFEDGWMIKVRASTAQELGGLKSAEDYEAQLAEEEE